MITPKIKNLFQFIEYLHSNIDNFNLNNDLIKELELLSEERQKVIHKRTFKDKLKYDEVQAEIEKKLKILQENTASLIKDKAKELNVCNFDNEPYHSFNGVEAEIHQLKDNFSNEDLPEIFKHKNQYIEYRSSTHKTFLSLEIFFEELDEITKNLFDYFKETEHNEFEAFEIKAIPANNFGEVFKMYQQRGHKKFTLPNSILNPSTFQQPVIEALPPQQNETKTEQETIEIKPALKPEAVQVVFNILKDFFSTEQQAELKQIIETGNKASKKLLFKGNGNRLTDTFKKLIEHDFIPGCPKLNLINWIISNFTFTQQNKVKAFIYGTVEKTISRNDNPCKSPLIEIKNGQIQKVEQPRTKKYNKY
jgi:hypothetical protein